MAVVIYFHCNIRLGGEEVGKIPVYKGRDYDVFLD